MKKILFLIGVLFFFSCAKQDRENTIVNQEQEIDRYIKSLGNVRVVRNGGSNRIVSKEGTGIDTLAIGDSVSFYYAGYIFGNGGKGPLFVTNSKAIAEEEGFILEEGVKSCVLSNKNLIKGLVNGLVGAKNGEFCNVIFSAKYGYDNTQVYNVPRMSPLFFEIWIENIVKN